MEESFINQIAGQLVAKYGSTLDTVTIVLPNKRAKVFLEFAFKQKIQTSVFAPKIWSIEELLFELTQIKPIDSVVLLFEFYEVYQKNTPSDQIQDFDTFSSWATTLLQDFNEIDRYLLDPHHVLSYLKDIQDINHWSVDAEQKTPLISSYLAFYERLQTYYDQLYQKMLTNQQGYQGLIYREAIKHLEDTSKQIKTPLIFAGFNALNKAEEHLFQYFVTYNSSEIIWDIDQIFYNDSYHEAGYFARKIHASWKMYRDTSFTGIVDVFSKTKKIEIIGTPKTVGQAKIVGSIIEQLHLDDLSSTAIVLGDENLLEPLLYALPNTVDKVNITMGLSAKNNPIQIFFNKVFRLHINAMQRDKYVFYYKDLIEVLSHPVISSIPEIKLALDHINKRNSTFIESKRLFVWETIFSESVLFSKLFKPWEDDALSVINHLEGLMSEVKKLLQPDNKKLTQVYLYCINTVFTQLKTYFNTYTSVTSIKTLYALYKQAVQLAEVSFEGEPLGGLQIMGVLESRTLDFDNVIITSLNEGTLPAGKSTQSFIPYDVKIEKGLPTYREKDAIYSYHFYHLLMRAKNVYLLYNTESEGLDAGEKSRFITQLEIEKQANHQLSHQVYAPFLPATGYIPIQIVKSVSIQERLHQIAQKGFSPSSLTTYLRDPIQFYYQRVLGLSELEEVEETIAVNTLGTIIHETLYELFKPYIGVFLTTEAIQKIKQKINTTIQQQFEILFAEGDILHGKNLLAFEVAKRTIANLIDMEEQWIKDGDAVKIIALEEKYSRTLSDPRLPYDVTLSGEVDRIEERNGKIRIIDYKTGKVEPTKLKITQWENLLDIEYDKVIQLLAYSYLYFPNITTQELEAGIISFKNLSQGFMPFTLQEEKEKYTVIDSTILDVYKNNLIDLLVEILDPNIPFQEKTI